MKGKHAISMSITTLWLGTGLAIGYLLVLREVNDFLSEGEFLFSLFSIYSLIRFNNMHDKERQFPIKYFYKREIVINQKCVFSSVVVLN